MILLKSVFLIAIVAVAMIGVMVPSVFADDSVILYKFQDRWNWNGSTNQGEGPGQFSNPGFIVIDSKDVAYVGDSTGRIQIFSTNGDLISEFGTLGSGWGDIEINSKDEVYVAYGEGYQNYKIGKLSANGEIIETWGTADSDNYKIDLPPKKNFNFFIDNSDNLYFSVPESTSISTAEYDLKVLKYSPNGKLLKTFDQMARPSAQDTEGNLYGIGKCSIVKYNSLGDYITRFGTCDYRGGYGTFSGSPADIIVGTDGFVYATGGDANPISKFSQDGKLVGGAGGYGNNEDQFGSTKGIALDSKNNIYFTDSARHSVFVFAPFEIITKKSYSANPLEWTIKIPETSSNNIEFDQNTWGDRIFGMRGDPLVWTDKDYYQKGETVIFSGKFSPEYDYKISQGEFDSLSVKLNAGAQLMNSENPGIYTKEIGKIKVNDDRTFSFSFSLSDENYPEDDNLPNNDMDLLRTGASFFIYTINFDHPKSTFSYTTSASTSFFVGNEKANLEQFEIWVDRDLNYFGIDIDKSKEDDYTVGVRNDLSVSRITLPSGLVVKSTGPYPGAGGDDFARTITAGGYGIYEFQVSYAGNVVSTKEIFEKPEPRPEISLGFNPESVEMAEIIKVTFNVMDADPEIQYFSYRLLDPEGKIVDYNTENFSSLAGIDRDGSTYHAMGLQWMKDIEFDTVTFPNISGKYIFEINYDGFIESQSFNFDSESTRVIIDKITSEFYGSMEGLRTKDHIDAFGKERSEKYFSDTSDTDFRIQYTKDMNQFQNEKLHDGLNSAESKIIALDISLDEQTELIFELREKAKAREESNNSQTQYDINYIIQSAQEYEQRIKLQEQYRLEQELLEKQHQSELDQIKDEIKSKIASTSKIASFVDQTKDPQYYIDRYNNEITYKEWFDENYSQYSSIYQAVGLGEPIVEPISEPVVESITEYTSEPIVEVTSTPTCGTGTESVNGICQVVQTKTTETSEGGGCLIATATYGSEMSTEVQQLRELRDNQLLQTESGTAFMSTFNDIYYSFSPIIADYERENPLFKEAVKLAITPMISTLSLMENAESESEVLSIGISVIMLNLGMYLGVPAVVIVGIRKRF